MTESPIGVMAGGVDSASSRNGVNFGVEGTMAADSFGVSMKGANPLSGVFELELLSLLELEICTGGGGMSAVSRYGMIFELELALELDAILLERPACLSVDPPNFLTSGTFSLTLILRDSRAFHSFAAASANCDSAPEGSTKI